MKKLIWSLLIYLAEFPLRLAAYAKKKLELKKFRSVGKNFMFDITTSSFSSWSIDIGNNVFIGKYAYIGGEVTIGNNVMFGMGVNVLGANHIFGAKGKSVRFLVPAEGSNNKPVIIKDEVWVGANVTIVGGVEIGMGAVIGAGSVISKDIPPYTVAVGNPCHPIKLIFNDNDLFEHLALLGYKKEYAVKILRKRNEMIFGKKLSHINFDNKL